MGFIYEIGLKVILCYDLDIILVGEICDEEIVKIVIRVSLIGYLVMIILYMNDVKGVIICFMDYGIMR